jgi:regulator of CtrA degradation
MYSTDSASPITRKLVDTLYVEAMVMADEARAYFDDAARSYHNGMDPLQRVSFSCESLKVTTRLMHVIAWLLSWRTTGTGTTGCGPQTLGVAAPSDDDAIDRLPDDARQLVRASADLYRRVARLAAGAPHDSAAPSPARRLIHQLEAAF